MLWIDEADAIPPVAQVRFLTLLDDLPPGVPASVFIGAEAVPPTGFLVGLAAAYQHQRNNGKLPEQILVRSNVVLLPARQVAEDTPGLFGGWVIHKADFRAPKILEVARLQTWTLKPAIRRE